MKKVNKTVQVLAGPSNRACQQQGSACSRLRSIEGLVFEHQELLKKAYYESHAR
jgi:hypothetical protein